MVETFSFSWLEYFEERKRKRDESFDRIYYQGNQQRDGHWKIFLGGDQGSQSHREGNWF